MIALHVVRVDLSRARGRASRVLLSELGALKRRAARFFRPWAMIEGGTRPGRGCPSCPPWRARRSVQRPAAVRAPFSPPDR